jgi:hypothetical protein
MNFLKCYAVHLRASWQYRFSLFWRNDFIPFLCKTSLTLIQIGVAAGNFYERLLNLNHEQAWRDVALICLAYLFGSSIWLGT